MKVPSCGALSLSLHDNVMRQGQKPPIIILSTFCMVTKYNKRFRYIKYLGLKGEVSKPEKRQTEALECWEFYHYHDHVLPDHDIICGIK